MIAHSSNRDATVISYYRDITEATGIPIAVIVTRIGTELFVRDDWQPVLLYDKTADVEFLQSFVEDLSKFQDSSELAPLLGAANSIRAERILWTEVDFDQKLSDLLRDLTKRP